MLLKNDEGGGNWSVDVIYDIENTGLHDISYWEVWFKVTTVGGETIEDSDFGYDLPVGDKVNDRAFNIDTLGYEPDSMPQSIEVSKKELESD